MQWFRFYSAALDDPKVQRLPGDLFKAWINLLCLANEADERGTLPPVADIAFRLRLGDAEGAETVAALVRAGLLVEQAEGLHIHGWEVRQKKSDDVTARVHKHRGKGVVTETLPKRFCNGLDKNRIDQSREELTTPPTPSPSPVAREMPPPSAADAPAPFPLLPRSAPKPAKGPPPKLLALFEQQFWPAWPKRVGRSEALSAFVKLRPTEDDVGRMVAAIPEQAEALDWPRENYRYCPNPATWLHQRRWEDEPPQPGPSDSHRPYAPQQSAQVSDRTLSWLKASRSAD